MNGRSTSGWHQGLAGGPGAAATSCPPVQAEARAPPVIHQNHPDSLYRRGRGSTIFVMQYVAGESLDGSGAGGKMRSTRRWRSRQALSGLAAAQDKGNVHRDISGKYIDGCPHHRVMLADFGPVKSLESSVAGKTANRRDHGDGGLTSLPTGKGADGDGRRLVFLGVLLYQMLSGRLPFVATGPTALVFQQSTKRCQRSTVPRRCQRGWLMIEQTAGEVAADRIRAPAELLADLRAFARGNRAASAD